MILRPYCLYENRLIGVDSLYVYVNGDYIKKEGYVEQVRALGRAKKLLCECGCGSNVELVFGDKSLRKPHFRINGSDDRKNQCHATKESENTFISKIILSSWLEKQTGDNELKRNYSASSVDKTSRRYLYSVISLKRNIAISYVKDALDLDDDKIDLFVSSQQKTFFVCDYSSVSTIGQYPERTMRLQNNQGFCLFLDISEIAKPTLNCLMYCKDDQTHHWNSITICNGGLDDYSIDNDKHLLYKGQEIEQLKNKVIESIELEKIEKRKKELEEKKREEAWLKWQEEQKQKEQEKIRKIEKEALEKKQREEERLRRFKEYQAGEPERVKKAILSGQPAIVDGNRWYECTCCHKRKVAFAFAVKDYPKLNYGVCNKCSRK